MGGVGGKPGHVRHPQGELAATGGGGALAVGDAVSVLPA